MPRGSRRRDPPNIGYYFATIEEGRYITGEVAGLVVDPGASLGYVAAHPIPEVFRGENAFALGVAKTNAGAKIHNRWTLTWFDPNLEKQAAESLLEPPVRASLLSQHQDSPAAQIAAQDAGKFGIAYDADMNDQAPKATLTAAVWDWSVQNKPTINGACRRLAQRRQVAIPQEYRNWMGSFKTARSGRAVERALASHPRKEQIHYTDEVAAFKSGQVVRNDLTGPIKDNTEARRASSNFRTWRRACTTSAAVVRKNVVGLPPPWFRRSRQVRPRRHPRQRTLPRVHPHPHGRAPDRAPRSKPDRRAPVRAYRPWVAWAP
jgi:hypothetical protein